MSPRAASRLEALGFRQVFDYVAGKVDWGAAGLPLEGALAGLPTAGDVADPAVPSCALGDDLGAVRDRVRAAGWDTCVVIDDRRIVLGRLGRAALATEDELSVEKAMNEGPSTVRPSLALRDLAARMGKHDLRTALVTTLDGRLVGLARREDVERLAPQ